MTTAVIGIFILGMMVSFYADNKSAIDKKSKKFKKTLED